MTLCGLSGFKTLPNKYKNSAYSSSRQIHKSEETSSKPPRPGLARSFSFSDSKTSNKQEIQPKCNVGDEKVIIRSGSINLNLYIPEPAKTENLQPLSRSLSLASLEPGYVPLHGHVAAPSEHDNHAGVWARGRRASSCRNIRDTSQDCTDYSKFAS